MKIQNPTSISKEAQACLEKFFRNISFHKFCYRSWCGYQAEADQIDVYSNDLDIYDPRDSAHLVLQGSKIASWGGEGDGAPLYMVWHCRRFEGSKVVEEFHFSIEGTKSSWSDNCYDEIITIVAPKEITVTHYYPVK